MTTMRVSPHWQCVVVFFLKEDSQAPFTLKAVSRAEARSGFQTGGTRPFNPLGSKDNARMKN